MEAFRLISSCAYSINIKLEEKLQAFEWQVNISNQNVSGIGIDCVLTPPCSTHFHLRGVSPPSDPPGAPSVVALCVVPCRTELEDKFITSNSANRRLCLEMALILHLALWIKAPTHTNDSGKKLWAGTRFSVLSRKCMSLGVRKVCMGHLYKQITNAWSWLSCNPSGSLPVFEIGLLRKQKWCQSVMCGGCFHSFLGYLILWPLPIRW